MEPTYRPDLSAYLERIQFSDSVAADLTTLHRIVEAHVASIPFENLDILMGRGISVAPADVEQKLVKECRGGYCFEQNTLLHSMLEHIGFDVTPLSARVLIRKPRHPLPSETHLFLRVELEGVSWLVDAACPRVR